MILWQVWAGQAQVVPRPYSVHLCRCIDIRELSALSMKRTEEAGADRGVS